MSDTKNNKRIWDALGKTNPKQTKQFTRAGGFSGTAIKPMWSYQRMTEYFGPCGIGWGPDKPTFDVVPAGEEMMVYCTVGMWYQDPDTGERGQVYGVGGDKVYIQSKSGFRSSDEAYKAAYTDALTNAMKLIGVAADVHMGRFDDSKYVREVTEEFASTGISDPTGQDSAQYPEPPPAKRITKAQRDKFIVAVKASNRTGEVKAFLEKNGFASSGEITTDVYGPMMNWAEEE